MVSDEWTDKPSRQQAADPVAEKRKDSARQRKIASNSSDKSARRNAPVIKARANRGARRAAKSVVAAGAAECDEGAQAAAVYHRVKERNWGSINAAEHRKHRTEENRVLNETVGLEGLPRGRRRFQELRSPSAHNSTKEE